MVFCSGCTPPLSVTAEISSSIYRHHIGQAAMDKCIERVIFKAGNLISFCRMNRCVFITLTLLQLSSLLGLHGVCSNALCRSLRVLSKRLFRWSRCCLCSPWLRPLQQKSQCHLVHHNWIFKYGYMKRITPYWLSLYSNCFPSTYNIRHIKCQACLHCLSWQPVEGMGENYHSAEEWEEKKQCWVGYCHWEVINCDYTHKWLQHTVAGPN